jgi:hypothetical protein
VLKLILETPDNAFVKLWIVLLGNTLEQKFSHNVLVQLAIDHDFEVEGGNSISPSTDQGENSDTTWNESNM